MEIPLLRYHSVSLDQISNTRRKSLLHFKQHKSLLFSGYCFSFSKRKWRNPFDRIGCCSLEQGLQPPWGLKPKPKPSKMDVVERKGAVLEEPQMRKQPSSGICSQIEKLVFNKRYREALELFEILEFEGGFELESSTYDALISACIVLNSIRGVKRVSSFMSSNGFDLDLYMRNRVLLMHVKG